MERKERTGALKSTGHLGGGIYKAGVSSGIYLAKKKQTEYL